METGNVVIWKSNADSKYCVLGGLKGVDDVFEIKRGLPRAEGFPEGAHFEMSKRFPRQVKLPDSALNADRMVVASAPLKALIESKQPPSVELLRVSIINHKGRVASPDYYIISPLQVVDCIDKASSDLDWNVINPSLISGCMKLVLDLSAVDDSLLFFRPKHLEYVTFVRRDLAQAITDAGFTGVDFAEVDDFKV